MSNSTYLTLTNRLLQKFNETTLKESDFSSAYDIQAAAKNSINDSIAEMMTYYHFWPFNAVEQTDTILNGAYEYAWPSDFKAVDWDSFLLEKNEELCTNARRLKLITKIEHQRKYYEEDRMGITDSNYRSIPKYVFQTHGQGYGVSPNPQAQFELTYQYYKKFEPLVAFDDETEIPAEYDHVIIYGGMKHMNLFLDNTEQANYCEGVLFKPALTNMRTLMVNDYHEVTDRRINF